MEILRIKVDLTGCEKVEGSADTAVMIPFTGRCESPLFTGDILPGGVDTQRVAEGRCALSARYMLEGTDSAGQQCRLFIQNEGLNGVGDAMQTRPVIRTDSAALRWLETADLTGIVEHHADHIEIVIDSANTPEVEHIALRRAGLTLRGVLQKPGAGKYPLVLLLHGFCSSMEDILLRQLSDGLIAAGFATLRFDFNGHGRSDGLFSEMNVMNEVEDAAAFLRYVLSREDVASVSVVGHSQGGVVAGMLAGYYRDAVQKLVMLCPAASLKTDAQLGTVMGTRFDPANIPDRVRLFSGAEVGGQYFRIAQTLPLHEVAACFTGRALAIVGGHDEVVHTTDILRYGDLMSNCRVLEYPTLDHGLGGAERDIALSKVITFLK